MDNYMTQQEEQNRARVKELLGGVPEEQIPTLCISALRTWRRKYPTENQFSVHGALGLELVPLLLAEMGRDPIDSDTLSGLKEPFITEQNQAWFLSVSDFLVWFTSQGFGAAISSEKQNIVTIRLTRLGMQFLDGTVAASAALPSKVNADLIGDWRRLKELRRDGQGEVFLVLREGSPGHALGVLKRIPRDVVADTKRVTRFKHEIEIVRQLRHPFIAEVLDANLDGEMWFVTKFAPFGSLLDNVGWFKGDAWRTLRLGRDIGIALSVAHANKIIHRDVKPGNILLYGPEHAALTDFGIAHHADQTAATSTHEKVGPGWFIPPEAEHGRTDPDCAHDVYMLGKVLYYTLTGGNRFSREKFADGNANIESMFERPDFAVINELFGRMIVEDPVKRLQSMEAVVAAIDTTLARLSGGRSLEQETELNSRLTDIVNTLMTLQHWQFKAERDLETAFQSFGELYLNGYAPHRKAPTRQG